MNPKEMGGIPSVQIPNKLLERKQHSLVRGDGNGNLKDWWGSLDLHALKLNPLVGDLKADDIITVVLDRHNRVEQRVIANVDLFREIESKKDLGEGGSGLAALQEVTQIIQPMIEPLSLSIDLYMAKSVTAMQGKFNEELVRQYKKKQTESLSTGSGSNPIAGFVKFMLKDGMREPRFAHDLMVSEILMNYDEIIKAAGLEGRDELIPLGELAGRVGDEDPRRLLIRRATPYIMALTIDEHINLLMTVRELRENPDLQPMLNIELLADGQENSTYHPGDEFTHPGDIKTGYSALDPNGTGNAGRKAALTENQIGFYKEYLVRKWISIDPDATGHHMDEIIEQYQPDYEEYLAKRRAEMAEEGTEAPEGETAEDGG